MMNNKTFLAVSGQNLTRASRDEDGDWQVESLMSGQGPCCLAADPSDRHVVYAGTSGNGVFRSEDRGQTWSAHGLSGQIVKSLAVSPHDPNTIYAGLKPASVSKSTDGGQTWTEQESFRGIRGRRFWFSPAEPPDKLAYVQALTISPTEPDVVLTGI